MDRLSKPGFGPVGIFSQSGALASAILNEVGLDRLVPSTVLMSSSLVVTMMAGSPSLSVSVMLVM